LKLLKRYVGNITTGISSGTLFPEKPEICFYPEVESCTSTGCESKLFVQKTWTKTIVTMEIGAFQAKEVVLQCPDDETVYTSSQLRSLAPSRCTYGFDVIVHVGTSLFVHCLNEQQIASDLAKKNIFISEREIGYLGRKFVIYLALAHRQSREQLVQLMAKKGGYILHVDGTCEGNSPHLFCGIDGISKIVLDNIKLPAERKELLIPFFKRIKEQYGNPIALVHDMGVGILAAVKVVFAGLPDFICHFHFLRDVGKDLLLKDDQTIIQRLKAHNVRGLLRRKARYLEQKTHLDPDMIADLNLGIEGGELKQDFLESIPALATYTLIHWLFEAPHPSKGYGFPFERPHLAFYERLKKVHGLLTDITDIYLRDKPKDNRSFIQVLKLLEEVLSDKELKESAAVMAEKAEVFDMLREALEIAKPDGKEGLNDDGDETDIKTIEQKTVAFKEFLMGDEKRKKTYAKMIQQMDKFWKKLFSDPIEISSPTGQYTIQPQRTNNILERFFRGEKRRGRKKSGTASLNRTLKAILADTPLIRNLSNEDYKRIILNGCSTLAERFSQIDEKTVREELKRSEAKQEKIPTEIKRMIKQSDFPDKISKLFYSTGKKNANCYLPT